MSYQTGTGVTQDHQKALQYFRRAEALGDQLAAYKIGCFYAGQDDVQTPIRIRRSVTKRSPQMPVMRSRERCRGIYARRGEPDAARDWIAKAGARHTASIVRFRFDAQRKERTAARWCDRRGLIYVVLGREEPDDAQRQWLEKERSALPIPSADGPTRSRRPTSPAHCNHITGPVRPARCGALVIRSGAKAKMSPRFRSVSSSRMSAGESGGGRAGESFRKPRTRISTERRTDGARDMRRIAKASCPAST